MDLEEEAMVDLSSMDITGFDWYKCSISFRLFEMDEMSHVD
jgi:hypothetical protein